MSCRLAGEPEGLGELDGASVGVPGARHHVRHARGHQAEGAGQVQVGELNIFQVILW